MKRRDAIAIGGLGVLGGGGAIVGTTLYGSSTLEFDRSGERTAVYKDGEQIESLNPAITVAEDDDALLGLSLPEQSTVSTVGVEAVWAIQRDGLWSDVIVEFESTGEAGRPPDSGQATGYGSTWGNPSETRVSPTLNRYAYPRGTTAGHVYTSLLTEEHTMSAETTIELEARLSARSLSGACIDLVVAAEMIHNPE